MGKHHCFLNGPVVKTTPRSGQRTMEGGAGASASYVLMTTAAAEEIPVQSTQGGGRASAFAPTSFASATVPLPPTPARRYTYTSNFDGFPKPNTSDRPRPLSLSEEMQERKTRLEGKAGALASTLVLPFLLRLHALDLSC